MKPITEDQVICLIKGIESREKKALKCIAPIAKIQDSGGRMTARVLKYTPSKTENRTHLAANKHPVLLDEARAACKARRSAQGFFFYSLVAGQTLA